MKEYIPVHVLAVGDYTQSARYVRVRHAMHCIAIREVKYSGNELPWLLIVMFCRTGIPFCRIVGNDVNQ